MTAQTPGDYDDRGDRTYGTLSSQYQPRWDDDDDGPSLPFPFFFGR